MVQINPIEIGTDLRVIHSVYWRGSLMWMYLKENNKGSVGKCLKRSKKGIGTQLQSLWAVCLCTYSSQYRQPPYEIGKHYINKAIGRSHGAIQQKEMNNWRCPMVKRLWTVALFVQQQFFQYSITTSTYHLGRSSTKELLTTNSLLIFYSFYLLRWLP